jgi:hypothetical protein
VNEKLKLVNSNTFDIYDDKLCVNCGYIFKKVFVFITGYDEEGVEHYRIVCPNCMKEIIEIVYIKYLKKGSYKWY